MTRKNAGEWTVSSSLRFGGKGFISSLSHLVCRYIPLLGWRPGKEAWSTFALFRQNIGKRLFFDGLTLNIQEPKQHIRKLGDGRIIMPPYSFTARLVDVSIRKTYIHDGYYSQLILTLDGVRLVDENLPNSYIEDMSWYLRRLNGVEGTYTLNYTWVSEFSLAD